MTRVVNCLVGVAVWQEQGGVISKFWVGFGLVGFTIVLCTINMCFLFRGDSWNGIFRIKRGSRLDLKIYFKVFIENHYG